MTFAFILNSSVVWLFCSFIISASAVASCRCGEAHGLRSRIINGVVAKLTYPWMALILRFDHTICAGSVINDRYILTAAHCASGYNVRELTVALGVKKTDQMDTNVQKFGDLRAIVHPRFKSVRNIDNHDIALLKLPRRIVFNFYIAPVCLPRNVSQLYEGLVATIAGWGKPALNKAPTKDLMEAQVKVIDNTACRNTTLGRRVKPNNLCAYNNGIDSCQGDSGGPLFYPVKVNKYDQVGIVSWGLQCATKGVPGVYTRLTHYIHWIHAHTKDAVYCA